MKAGTVFRIGIYLIGLWTLSSGLTSAAYYSHAILSNRPVEWSGVESHASAIVGHALVPLAFAFMCFGFGGRISRAFLGSATEDPTTITARGEVAILRAGVKFLGIYLFAITCGHMAATIFELIAVRQGSRAFTEGQVTSDLIANAAGIAFALGLAFRTHYFVGVLWIDDKTA